MKKAKHNLRLGTGVAKAHSLNPDLGDILDISQIHKALNKKYPPSDPVILAPVQEYHSVDTDQSEDEPEPAPRIDHPPRRTQSTSSWMQVLNPKLEENFENSIEVTLDSKFPWIDCYPTDQKMRIVLYPLPPGAIPKVTKRADIEVIYVSISWKTEIPKETGVTRADIARVRRDRTIDFHFKFDFRNTGVDFGAPIITKQGAFWICYEISLDKYN